MLAGGYSKSYQTMEKSNIQILKDIVEIDRNDTIARARRLSQETNKRRKHQIQKRKFEAQREEKRREEILARRRDEQRKATERFQRATIPNIRPGSRRSSPNRNNTEDALRLIRGHSGTNTSRQSSASSIRSNPGRTSPRAFSSNNYRHESSNRLNTGRNVPHNPMSSKERADNYARQHAQMMDRSFRNMANSRSLFESQLEHHQQLLVEDQKKALHQFNEAIMNEIEHDQDVLGTLDIDTEMGRSDSLSSLDSLDEDGGGDHDKTLSNETVVPVRSEQMVFTSVARVTPSSAGQLGDVSENKQKSVTLDQKNSTSVPQYVLRAPNQSRILEEVINYQNCGDIDSPTSLNSGSASSFLSNQVNPNTDVGYGLTYQNGLQMAHVYSTKSALPVDNTGSAAQRMNQNSSYNVSQYDSSAVSQVNASPVVSSPTNQNNSTNRFILSQVNIQNNSSTSDQIGRVNKLFADSSIPTHYSSILAAHASPVIPTSSTATTYVIGPRQLASRTGSSNTPPQTRELITSESPTTNNNFQNWQVVTTSPSGHLPIGHLPAESMQSHQVFHPHNVSVGQSGHVNQPVSHQQHVPIETTFSVSQAVSQGVPATTLAWTSNSHSTSVPQVVSKFNYSTTSLQNSTVNCKTIANSISSDINTHTVAATSTKPITCEKAGKTNDVSKNNEPKHTDPFSGTISGGTLGFVNGKLTAITATGDDDLFHKPPKPCLKKTTSDIQSVSVQSILKRPGQCVLKKTESMGSLHVRDSIEVIKSHLNQNSEGQISTLPKKKSVRFSDLDYNEPRHVEDQDKEVDEEVDKKVPASTKAKPKSKLRPVSAKVLNLRSELPPKGVRTVSANMSQHAQDRPKAAAHIITHSIEGAQFLREQENNSNSNAQEKKVKVVNNNFMEKVPVTSQHGGYGMSNGYGNDHRQIEIEVPTVSDFTPSASKVDQISPVFDENGLRIDRTPTDDEINSLWDKVRTCLDNTPTSTDKRNQYDGSVDSNSKQIVTVSNKYIDGTSLGIPSSTRGASAYNPGGVQQRALNSLSVKQRPTPNGYLRRYGLLQQRRGGTGRTLIAPQQDPVNNGPTVSQQGPQAGTNFQIKDDPVTDSVAAFMVAEKLAAQSATPGQVESAFDEPRRRPILQVKQPILNPGGTSALSMEERRLLESLERLNEKLKINESVYPSRTAAQQVSPAQNMPTPQQNVFVHNIKFEVQALPGHHNNPQPSGFRGHQPYQTNAFRPQSGYDKQTIPSGVEQLRVQSARHYR